MESYSRRIKSWKIRSKHRTYDTSVFDTRIARERILLLDPARGKENSRESSGSTTTWWRWSSWFFGRASPSATEEEECWERGRAAPTKWYGCPPTPSLFIGGRER